MLKGWVLAVVLPVLAALTVFGAVDRAVWSALAILSGGLLIALALRQLRARRIDVKPGHVRVLVVPAALGLVLGVLQIWPNPPFELAHPLWDTARQILDVPITSYVSVTPSDTLDVLIRTGSYFAIFWAALQLGRSRQIASAVLQWMVASIGAFAVYGLAMFLTGLEMTLWLEKTAYRGELTSTVVNRNTAATVLGIGWLASSSVVLGDLRNKLHGVETPSERRRIAAEYLFGKGLWLAGTWGLILSALFLTHSRAGLACSLVGLVVTVFLALRGRSFGVRVRVGAVAAILLGLIVMLAMSGGRTLDRFAELGVSEDTRYSAYAVSMQAIGDAPWTGSGLGSFREVFRIYQPADLVGIWGKAHSTYIENALEGGLIWAVSMCLPLLFAGGFCLAGAISRGRDIHFAAFGAGVVVLVGLHSLVDFSLQIPAVSALTACILGVCVAQSWSSREDVGVS